jgi:deoxyribose-phosphate aldolase
MMTELERIVQEELQSSGLWVNDHPEYGEYLVECGADRLSCTVGLIRRVKEDLAHMIDHTLLKPEGTTPEVMKLVSEARDNSFASVCVNPYWVSLCAGELRGTKVDICTVVGFPLGATTRTTKAAETTEAISNGATEIDMVLNVGALKDGNFNYIRQDIGGVVRAAGGRLVKVILETCLLTDQEIIQASLLAQEAGASFVKTSTGFNKGGATAAHVALMRRVVGRDMGVKASGGVRSFGDALTMLESGADRIGASASVAIIS